MKNINQAHFYHFFIALYQINSLALVMSKFSKYYKRFGKNIDKCLDTFAMAFIFKSQLYLLRKQSICNLATILSLYCTLQYTHFVIRMLNNYIALLAAYLLRESFFMITKENLSFLYLCTCFTKKQDSVGISIFRFI